VSDEWNLPKFDPEETRARAVQEAYREGDAMKITFGSKLKEKKAS
jgi:hypothetical protein